MSSVKIAKRLVPVAFAAVHERLPDADAFLAGVAQTLLPDYALRLGSFLAQTDELDDGPTFRIVQQALRDVRRDRD